MSDDISIPRVAAGAASGPVRYTPSYRPRRAGMDPSTRRLCMVASGLGLLLLGGMGVWTFSGHHAAGVPVIEADSRPLRVKPDDAGGMSVIGANDQVLGGRGDGAELTGDLAPPAERPDPQALRAQRAVLSPAPASDPVVTPAVVTPAVVAPSANAVAAAPAQARPGAPPAAGTVFVQVAAVDSEAGTQAEWQRLSHKAPDLLGDRKLSVAKTERDGKTFWRLRTGGFADIAGATEFCRKLRAKGLGCSIGS
ncbi:MAG: SPOR domain-containing protein [Acetobacteraceae bacterium]|nr:SPOR domain-containing protein [Acetobacteraceae bacterium]